MGGTSLLAAVRALDCVAAAIFVVDGGGGLRHANATGRQLLASGRGVCVQAGVMRLRRASEQAVFAAALAGGGRRLLSFANRAGQATMILRIEPVAGADEIVVCVTNLHAPLPLAPGWSRLSLGLTPGVAALAETLANGASLAEISTEGRLPIGTARTRLKRLLARIGLSSQHALVGYLSRIATIMADLRD